MILGEGPGRNEDLQGRPFVGAAGKILERLLAEAGLARGSVFITNIVKCRPPENRRPTASESVACRPYLDRQLAILAPRVVVLLGDSALRSFLPDERLARAHGRPFAAGGLTLFPTYHPAAMIYNRSLEETTARDFAALGRVVEALG